MKYLIAFGTDIVRHDQAPEWGVDKVLILDNDLSDNLSNLPEDNESVWFIPTVQDSINSLSYGGVSLALRIFMRYLRNGITNIDIVLLGNETERNFLLHYDYPNILKIPGFHYIQFNKKIVASYLVPQRVQLKTIEYKPYLDKLGLKIPSSLKSTHSLTNEWCLFKWNSFMGFDEDSSLLENHLYFEYLITIEKLNSIKNISATENLKERISKFHNTRILVIDDKKGWHIFFEKMFNNTDNVDIRSIGEDFNKLGFIDIEKRISDEVNSFNPHVIILDFRLMEDKDAEIKDDIRQISGYQVLSKVLKGNYTNPLPSFGRQVIIFTATGRIENILLLKKGNADGFILKEKPEYYSGKETTKNVVSKMISTIERAVDRAKFLIPINEKLDQISSFSNSYGCELKTVVNTVCQTVRQSTQDNDLNLDVLNILFLSLFSIFEEIKRDSNFVQFPNNETLIVNSNSRITVCNHDYSWIRQKSKDDQNFTRDYNLQDYKIYCQNGGNMNFAICAIILFRLGYNQTNETNWNTIRLIRNAIAHNDDSKINKINIYRDINTLKEYILKMSDLLIEIMNKDNIKDVNLKR